MRAEFHRAVGRAGVVAALLSVAGYVAVVALRGPGTHLGEDTIALVYVAVFGLIAVSLGMGLWDYAKRRSGRPTLLVFLLSLGVLGAWAWLHQSGRVMSYGEMINRTQSGPQGGASGWQPSTPDTNEASGAAATRRSP